MIQACDAVAQARSLLGTPYAQMDCMALVRTVIRRAPGGERGYRCQGTNWLWNSARASGKYRHLIWRQEGTQGAQAGMLAFKRRGGDVHHVGLVTGSATVVHASSESGRTVETPLDGTWQLLARHRLIRAQGGGGGVVRTQGGRLNVRSAPQGEVIAQLRNGAPVALLSDEGDWLRVVLEDGREGYVSAAYIQR